MANNEKKLQATIKTLAKSLPIFSDGRIDYSNANAAPVITVFIQYDNEILLLKRSNKVSTYQGKWNTVAGYLDEIKPLHEKILEELSEELGISEDNILSHHIGESYTFTDPTLEKTWIVYPALVKLRHKLSLQLDWEHTEYRWIKPKELGEFDHVPKLDQSLKKILKWID
jgi:isopentenyldiphosphate isomerase